VKLLKFFGWTIAVLGMLILMGFGLENYGAWGLAVPFAFLGIVMNRQKGAKQVKQVVTEQQAFTALCQDEEIGPKPNYSDSGRGLYLGLDEQRMRVLVQARSPTAYDKKTWAWWVIDVKRVLNVELAVNDQAVYRAGPVATLAGAAVGGLAFGGFGAITGALATGRTGAGKISALALKLRVDDIDQPLIEIPFIVAPVKASDGDAQARMALAEKWTNLIEVLRHRMTK
jgi:hypothetical protein